LCNRGGSFVGPGECLRRPIGCARPGGVGTGSGVGVSFGIFCGPESECAGDQFRW